MEAQRTMLLVRLTGPLRRRLPGRPRADERLHPVCLLLLTPLLQCTTGVARCRSRPAVVGIPRMVLPRHKLPRNLLLPIAQRATAPLRLRSTRTSSARSLRINAKLVTICFGLVG